MSNAAVHSLQRGSATRRCRWLAGTVSALGLAASFTGVAAAADEPATLADATVHLAPEGLPARDASVRLSHRWDDVYGDRAGRAVYRLRLPPHAGPEPMAVLFTRVGNQAEVRVNGALLERLGTLGDSSFDAAKISRMVTLPAATLHRDAPNELEVEITAQPLRWGGLSLVRYGTREQVEALYDQQHLGRHHLSMVIAAGFALMGLASLALWRQQRDPLYGSFGLAALLGVVRHLDRVWPDVPVPWPAWGGVVAAAYALHLVLMFQVALLMLDALSPRLRGAVHLSAAVSVALAIACFLFGQPLLWTLGLWSLAPAGVAVVVVIAQAAFRQRRPLGWILLSSVALAAVAGFHDVSLVRMGLANGARISTLPFALFAIALIMAGLIVQRYNRTVLDFRRLNAELADRVAQRESELRQAFQSLQAQQEQQAVQQERQRIMREIHDGIGAQLVGLLNLAGQGPLQAEQVQEHVNVALDEMRMAVDSLQPVHGDLTTVLAMLRYRLQPRLSAAGIEVVWNVPQLAPLQALPPQSVLQVQRILLEAFTNVLKHAKASRVTVGARELDGGSQGPPAIELTIEDNGIGLDPDTEASPHSRGLANMQARAQSMGARLTLTPAQPHGTRVSLRWVR